MPETAKRLHLNGRVDFAHPIVFADVARQCNSTAVPESGAIEK